MSVQATTWVWAHSKAQGVQRLVALAVADAANAQGDRSCQSVATVAAMVQASERTVQRALRDLEASGELVNRGTDRRYRTTIYGFAAMMPEGDTGDAEGDNQRTLWVTDQVAEGDTAMSPDPSNPKTQPQEPKRTAKPPAPQDAIAKALYDGTQGALPYMGMRVIAAWALQVKGASSAQIIQAGLDLYAMGKPVVKPTMGQALDGAIRTPNGSARDDHADHWAAGGQFATE